MTPLTPLDHIPCDTIAGRSVLFVMATDHEYGSALRRLIRPLLTGVGPVESALATGAALARLAAAGRSPALVVSLGSAGSRRCPLGEVRQVSGVSWRDMDATAIGVPRGVTPFSAHPRVLPLPTPLPGVASATLSTGADIVSGERYDAIDADLVDMESFAVARACHRFGVPMIGWRGISDGPGTLDDLGGWTAMLPRIDRALAGLIERLAALSDPAWAALLSPPTGSR